jgi:hypothetical protein
MPATPTPHPTGPTQRTNGVISQKMTLFITTAVKTSNPTLVSIVFDNRVLRRIFGPKRDEVIRGWRKQHSEDLHNFYI